jgi:histidinol phosphatase-like PHP family hydrolase
VETVEDLQDAIDLGRLQQLIGVGPKTAQYWLRAIGEQREGVPIYRALDYANELIALLGRTLPEVNVEVAGALRRLDEWIVEIELAASDLDSVRSFLADSAAVAALPVPVTVTGPKPRDERPGVVAMADLRGDLHCHSDWSPDGRQTLSQLVRAAADRGYEYVGITDHAIGLRFGGLDADRVNAQRAEIVHLRAEHPSIKILHGMELNIDRDGSVDFEEELLEWLDYTVAGAHSLLNLGRNEQTTRMLRAVSNPQVDIIAHLTGRRIGIRPAIELDLAAIFSAAREHGTALEVNGHLDRLDLSAELIGAARKEGVLFAANSDAHRVSELSNAGNAVTLLQRGGAPPAAVINCLDLESLRRKL